MITVFIVVAVLQSVWGAEDAPDKKETVPYRNRYAPVAPVTDRLLLSFPDTPGALFTINGWKMNSINHVYTLDYPAWLKENRAVLTAYRLAIEAPGKYTVNFRLELGASGRYQQEITRHWANLILRGCQRPNTTGGAAPLPVPGATFVANFVGEYNEITYVLANLQGIISSFLPYDRAEGNIFDTTAPGRLYASNAELLALAGRMNDLLSAPPAALLQEAAHGEMLITLTERSKDHAIFTWPEGDNMKNCWVRLDAEAGELEVLPGDQGWVLPPQTAPRKILLTNCPVQGTTLHLYAISADGTSWHHRAFTVPAYHEGRGAE